MNVNDAVRLAIGLLCFACFGLACAGGVVGYSPVPFWDMWDGTVLFMDKLGAGDWSVLWGQHNEHRIVLTRLLFLAEYGLLGGGGKFLIVVNYVLVILAAATFWRALVWAHVPVLSTAAVQIGAFVTLAWLSLWTQENNFTWAFQSQFFLAQLFPLWALLLLARAADHPTRATPFFWVALIVGILSAGTMANGLLTLPLMILLAWLSGVSRLRLAVLIVAASVTIALYLYGYHAPTGHGSLVTSLRSDPFGVLLYTCRYLGSPFYFLIGQQSNSAIFAGIAGAFLALTSLITAALSIQQKPRHPLRLALICFLAYIGASAFITAGGRLPLGLDTAFASRYTTPAIMAWAALFAIHARWILAPIEHAGLQRNLGLAGAAAVCGLILNYQLKALTPRTEELHRRAVAALGLELRVADQDYIGSVYPDMNVALSIADRASEKNVAVFGLPRFKDLRERLGETATLDSGSTCIGHLDRVEPIQGESGFVRVHGWMFDQVRSTIPSRIEFVDSSGLVVGYALSGLGRPDVANAVSQRAAFSGFTGYIASYTLGRPITASAESCSFSGLPPAEQVRIIDLPALSDSVTVGADAIIGPHDWSGSDYARSNLTGLIVLGTYKVSDADTGSISLRLNKGDQILYRSGPTAGHQMATPAGAAALPLILPASPDWRVIAFPEAWFDSGETSIEMTDNGTDWGEWSAIAVKPAP